EKIYAQLKAGKTPRRLKLPRTRLWQRLALTLLPIAGISFVADTFLPGIGLVLMLLLSMVAGYSLTRRLESLSAEARKVFNNPLMEL
ncbi:chemotaxis protein, partial [Vibrio anguillarum]|nr:chemotaxis protein [Vibrio anguillarum]